MLIPFLLVLLYSSEPRTSPAHFQHRAVGISAEKRAVQAVQKRVPKGSYHSIYDYTEHIIHVGRANGIDTRNLWSAKRSGKDWLVMLATEMNGEVREINKALWSVDRNFRKISASNELARGIESDIVEMDKLRKRLH